MAKSSDSRWDGASGCLTCDRVNVSHAAHAVAHLANCDESDPETIDEALALIKREIEAQYDTKGGPDG